MARPAYLTRQEQDALVAALQAAQAETVADYDAADAIERGQVIGRLLDWVRGGETLITIDETIPTLRIRRVNG